MNDCPYKKDLFLQNQVKEGSPNLWGHHENRDYLYYLFLYLFIHNILPGLFIIYYLFSFIYWFILINLFIHLFIIFWMKWLSK